MEAHGKTTFAKAVRAERKRLELTQTQLADKVGTTQQNVAGWESSKSLPRPETWELLVGLFGQHSPVALLPPRGEIPGGTEVLYANQAIERASNRSLPARGRDYGDVPYRESKTATDPHVDMLAKLFATLPDDVVLRSLVFGECARVIAAAKGSGSATSPSAWPRPYRAHESKPE